MGKMFDAIDARLEAFVRDQRVFLGQMSPLLTPR